MKTQIKKIRQALMMTQTEFADMLGLSRNMIALYESGKHSVSIRILKKIATIARTHKIEFNAEEFLGIGEHLSTKSGDK